jgi:MerR family transcriptional regulator, light-induced transcriptional regulator
MAKNTNKTFSPKQLAQGIGVSEASIKRWCDKGILATSRTGGGHRRIPLESVITFLKENQYELIRPDILGLPTGAGRGEWTYEQARKHFASALEAGDEVKSRQIVLDLYLAGHSIAGICDRVITPVFHQMGDKWDHGEVAVYQERRAVEILHRLLYSLREILPAPSQAAALAIGATLTGDPYSLPGLMVELTLQESGWQAFFYGCELPVDTICAAIQESKPDLFWLSVSAVESIESFLKDYPKIYETCESEKVLLALGGRMINHTIRDQIRYSVFCDNIEHLQTFITAMEAMRNKRDNH